MKFYIDKTSNDYDDDGNVLPPHKDARKERYDRIEVRTCNEAEFDRKFSQREGLWRSKGTDHGITKEGYIQRTHANGNEGYFIEIDTLEALLAFIDENGSLVLSRECDFPSIEIYNNYRE